MRRIKHSLDEVAEQKWPSLHNAMAWFLHCFPKGAMRLTVDREDGVVEMWSDKESFDFDNAPDKWEMQRISNVIGASIKEMTEELVEGTK